MVLRGVLKRFSVNAAMGVADRLGVNRLLRFRHRRIPLAVMYHGVTDRQRSDLGSSRHVTVAEFDTQLATLKRQFNIVSAYEWVEAVRHPTSAAQRLLTITFDDGYENNLLSAVPILQSHGLTACFFITTGDVISGKWLDHDLFELALLYGQGKDFKTSLGRHPILLRFGEAKDRLQQYKDTKSIFGKVTRSERIAFSADVYRYAGCPEPPKEYREQYSVLKPEQVMDMVQLGMEVGSHTASHAKLAECDDDEISRELFRASRDIQEMTGIPATEQFLAYPVGSYDQRVMRIAREVGHPAAFAVHSGVRPGAEHLYELPRVGIYRGDSPSRVAATTSGLLEGIKSLISRGTRK